MLNTTKPEEEKKDDLRELFIPLPRTKENIVKGLTEGQFMLTKNDALLVSECCYSCTVLVRTVCRLTATLFVVRVCWVASERLLKLTVCVIKPSVNKRCRLKAKGSACTSKVLCLCERVCMRMFVCD